MKKTYPTQGILNAKQVDLLLSKLIYSMEGMSNCHIDPHTQAIIVELMPDSDVAAIDKTMDFLIEQERHKRVIRHRTYVERKETAVFEPQDIEEVYTQDGSVRRDLAVALFEQVDRILVGLAERHQAKRRKYPAMIPLKVLEKCRYISSFPQNIQLVSEIPHRLEALERVRQTDHLGDIARISPYALSPAVCFHCYAELSERRLDEPLALTARGICCRHEAPWRLGKHRLNEFSMREIVLFGDSDYVEAQRKRFMEEVWGLFEALGFSGKMKTASDPFYFSEDSEKRQHQMIANMKYELIVTMGEHHDAFSIASFNNMGDSLCKPFHVLDQAYNPLQSGCIAFGIDRWVYALLLSYGPCYDAWPPRVKAALEKYEDHKVTFS
jgi:seryl-tRNA synthetase